MKKMFKLYMYILIFILLLGVWASTASAAEYTDTLRVGIYYGSGAVESLNLESPAGFTVGYSADRSFYSFAKISNTSVQVSKSPSGTHHLLYSSHSSAAELSAQLEALKSSGISAFPAYFNSSYCAFGGVYSSYEEAAAAAGTNSANGTPVAVSANALRLTDTASGNTLFVADSTTMGLAVFSADRENTDALLTISGSAKGTYRGGFECKPLSSGSLTVVNIVPVESYLYSVVCREMSPSWPLEALKTQAVCARNFALGRINHHSQYGFDVCRTVCCQAYSTTADQSESVHKAVDETRGELLFYENQLVQAVYSSSMGSSTENVKNVWGSSFPYLVSVENPYEDTENINNGKWTKTLTKARATEIMTNKGYDIGTVTEIKVLEYSDAGRVIKLLVKGTNGEKIFERESCRTIFSEATYSQKYTISAGGVTTHPVVKVATGSGTQSKTLSSVAVLTGTNETSTASSSFVASDGKVSKTYKSQTTSGDADTYIFSGEGWGHGVGMSQYGAKGMAEAGFGYEDILTHYYTGTHLEKAY